MKQFTENFLSCIQYILKYEGGYCNHPEDKGGPTKYGISLKWANDGGHPGIYDILDKDNDGKITENDIKNITVEDAMTCYYKYFWTPLKLDKINNIKICFLIFDACINHGLYGAIKLAQKTLAISGFPKITIDGIIGNQTITALNKVNENEFIANFQSRRTDYYMAIVKHDSTQNKFLNGWLNRIAKTNRDVNKL